MKTLLLQYILVGAAGALGAVARLAVATWCGRWLYSGFPIGTFVINVSGSFLLGWFLAMAGTRGDVSETTRLAVAVGFVGSYTTFSTFVFESNVLIDAGMGWRVMLNLVGSVVVGLAAVRAGMWLGR